MTRMLRIATAALALSVVALPAMAQEKAAGEDPVAARVNGIEIRRSEVVQQIQEMGSRAQQVPMQVLYPQLLKKMIITKLVSKQGYDMKLQNEKEVKDRLKAAEDQIVADLYVHRAVQPKITEDKIKARYDQLAAKFKPEDEVRARHILVPTEAEANDLLKQIKDGADFAKLATDKSKDTGSAKQGGDLGYFVSSAMVKPFADAAFALKVGEMTTKPVKTEFGYHIIKLEDRRKSSPPPIAEVKDQIVNQLGQEMVQTLVDDLEAKAKIEKFNPDGTVMKDAPKEEKGKKADKK
ncbi:MAG: peptidylprolyl isomerase [Alphaproteobacteria bacterium]|nr:peptidylprolyl isomerase [Alphaproteobacteria bacterium]